MADTYESEQKTKRQLWKQTVPYRRFKYAQARHHYLSQLDVAGKVYAKLHMVHTYRYRIFSR